MKKIFFATLSFYLFENLGAQNITTVIGNGMAAYSGDGGQASLAEINNPVNQSFDNSGNLYVVDRGNEVIRRVDAVSGIITTIAGNGSQGYTGDGGQATLSSLFLPVQAVPDAQGNVYISDSYNHRIRKIVSSTGIITTFAGNGVAAFNGDGGMATAASLNTPYNIAFDATGNLYIADRLNNRIRMVDISTGIINTVAGNGHVGYLGDGFAATSAELNNPIGIGLDRAGNIYIGDYGNNCVRKVIKNSGLIETYAGNGTAGFMGDGGLASSAVLNGNTHLALNGAENLFIADVQNNRIRRVDAVSGIITTVAGNGTASYSGDGGIATAATLNGPQGTAFDASGNLYVSDYGNNRVRKIANIGKTTSISHDEEGIQFVKIFPNPSAGTFTIQLPGFSNEMYYHIYNTLGQEVKSGRLLQMETSLNLNDLMDGIYNVTIIQKNILVSKKVLLQHE